MNEIEQEAERIVTVVYGDKGEMLVHRDVARTIALSAFAAGMKYASASTRHVPGKVCGTRCCLGAHVGHHATTC